MSGGRPHRTVAAALVPTLVCCAALLGGPSPGTAAQAGDPAGFGCAGVTLAPRLADPDRNPDGSPVAITPDARGRYVPVIMVHGWTGSSTHDDAREGAFSHRIDLSTNRAADVRADRSLIGQLQRVPGAAVFTFDYHEHSARWVDDEHIGPALGTAIDCLHRATGEEVVVVAHSMGGLATRYALSTGDGRADRVSTVITFGTPNTGSLLALLAGAALDVGAEVDRVLALLRLVLSLCGTASSESLRTGTACDVLGPPVRALHSEAGRALRLGSPQLAALKPFPSGVDVHALAGETTFTVPRLGWFALPWDTDRVPVGDMIVTAGSATHGADTTTTARCGYQLNVVRGLADRIGLALGTTAVGDVAAGPLSSFAGPCYHGNLMRTVQLTNEAVGILDADIGARSPNTVRFDGIGPLSLRLTAADLVARGYVDKGNLYQGADAACVRYAKDGEGFAFSVERQTGRVLAIRGSGDQALRTEIGGIHVGSTLAELRAAYAGHRIDEYLDLDFGQGSNGVVVDGPGGSIAFALADGPRSDYTSGRALITYLPGVGLPGHAPTNAESGC